MGGRAHSLRDFMLSRPRSACGQAEAGDQVTRQRAGSVHRLQVVVDGQVAHPRAVPDALRDRFPEVEALPARQRRASRSVLKDVEQNAPGVEADLAAVQRPVDVSQMTDLPDDRDAAVAALFEVHYRQLLALARRLLDDPRDAEDVVIEGEGALGVARAVNPVVEPAHRYRLRRRRRSERR